eukprot:TRINITY_DN23734_c0_g1_i1.p1 TRINITY_DN23734_c0_g1~~TRINITY_DN23734_c0_g1_i1.p1  ORF type:complete len:281 (-),score=29.75 TRINITY_DN23734_c0_g1_i1:260-1030(-)
MPRFEELPIRVQALLAWSVFFVLCGGPWVTTFLLSPRLFDEFIDVQELFTSLWHWTIVLMVAVAFEPLTWLIHKHLMHASMWWVHEDHHADTAYSRPEIYRNDFFPLVFAVPSSTAAMAVCVRALPTWVASVVLGAMLYGLAYLYVHEELFHNRFGLPGSATVRQIAYVKRLATAHGVHHRFRRLDGARRHVSFGFLYAPPRFDPSNVQRLVSAGEKVPDETLTDYYGPLFGACGPFDTTAAAAKAQSPASSSKSM